MGSAARRREVQQEQGASLGFVWWGSRWTGGVCVGIWGGVWGGAFHAASRGSSCIVSSLWICSCCFTGLVCADFTDSPTSNAKTPPKTVP